jgi:hypothetical protein
MLRWEDAVVSGLRSGSERVQAWDGSRKGAVLKIEFRRGSMMGQGNAQVGEKSGMGQGWDET